MRFFAFTILLTIAGAQESQLNGPQNTLSVVGSNVALKCSSPSRDCNNTEWLKYGGSGNLATVFNDRGIRSPAYRDRYSVDDSSGCDLIIKNVQLTDAGRFICRLFVSSQTVEGTAYLIIQETEPKCTETTFWDEIVEGDEVLLNCMVAYSGINRALMVWKEVENAPASVDNGTTISRSAHIVASAPELPSFTCITTFAVDTTDNGGALIVGLATNFLNTTTCATSAIKVQSAHQFRMEEPQNKMSFVGSTVTWKCLSPSRNASRIEWLKYSAGNLMPIFNDRVGISSAYRDRYSVDSSSGYALVMRNVQLTDAGRFICSIQTSDRIIERTAYLHIFETEPKCTIYASFDETVEGDGVQLNCILAYNDGITTKTVWNGVEDAPAAERNGNTLIWSYYVAAAAPAIPSFTCITSWAFATTNNNGAPIRGLARNIPNVTCATSALKVLYSVRDVRLSPSFSNYTTGSRIICIAKGHPSPTLKWQEMENGGTWVDIQNQNGCEFSITNISSKRYRCMAVNVVRGRSYNVTSHEFLLINTDHNDSTTALTTTLSPLPLIISVAVGAVFGFLLITLPVNCFIVRACPGYKFCYSGSKSKDKIRKEQPLTEVPDISNYANRVQDAHPFAKPRSVPPSEPSNRPQVATPQDMTSQTDNRKTGRAKPPPHVHKGRKDAEALDEHTGL